MPEAEQVDVTIEEKDLRIDVFRSSRPRRPVRQHHRLGGPDHPPARPASWSAARTRRASCRTASRRCASCGPGCSQAAQDTADAEASDARRSQVRTVDRSERIRTYNYPENRISDHRTGYKSYNLDQVLDGDLEPVIDSCVEADLAARLDALESQAIVTRRAGPARPPPGSPTAGVASPELRRRRAARPRAGHHPRRPRARRRASTPAAGRGVRRAGRAPRRPRAAAAPHRHRRLPLRRARGRARGVRAPPRDRAARRLGRRAGRRPWSTQAGCRSWSTSAPAPGRSRWRSRPRCRRPRCTPSSSATRRPRLGRPQPGRHRGRPAARRHGRRVPRPRRHRRRGGLQPALHPARGLRVGRPRGPRPRPATWRCSPARTGSSRCGSSSGSRPGCCGPAAWSAPSTPTCRASPRRPSSSATGRWSDVRDHADLAGRSALRDRATGTMTRCQT